MAKKPTDPQTASYQAVPPASNPDPAGPPQVPAKEGDETMNMQVDAPAQDPSGEFVKVKVSGNVIAEFSVPKGTKFEDVLARATNSPASNNYTNNQNGKSVPLSHAVNENMEVTAVAKASGG